MTDNEIQYKLGIYKHFKGRLYRLLHVAKSCEDDTKYAVYQALYGDHQVYVRNKDEFFGEKILEDGTKINRFVWVRNY